MTLHLACVVDRAYVPHCGVMLVSALTHTPGPVAAHVLHENPLPEDDRARLAQLAAGHGAVLTFHPVDPQGLEGLPLKPRFPAPEWYRLQLPQLLGDASRVLVLDCDLVVEQSLRPLWDTELGNALLAAVTDPLFAYLDRRWLDAMAVPPDAYFNSGVLLLNLARMRAEGTMAQVADFARGHAGLEYPFQDALNAVCHRRRRPLHPRWNVQSSFYERRVAPVLDPDELREALLDPAIVHFLGPWKPWHYRCKHPRRDAYARYRSQTPWAEWELDGRTLKHRLLRLLPDPVARSLARARAALSAP